MNRLDMYYEPGAPDEGHVDFYRRWERIYRARARGAECTGTATQYEEQAAWYAKQVAMAQEERQP